MSSFKDEGIKRKRLDEILAFMREKREMIHRKCIRELIFIGS
jgi:hypothetical protein